MQLDRFGNPIKIGWSAVEDEWCRAAATLPLADRNQAYADIAAMTSRSVSSCRSRGGKLWAEDRNRAREWLDTNLRKNWASGAAVEPVKAGPVWRPPARYSQNGWDRPPKTDTDS